LNTGGGKEEEKKRKGKFFRNGEKILKN